MTSYRGWMCYTWYLPCCEFPKVTTNWITVCKDSVHRCPPLVTRTIDCANWIMEPIASTYRRYLISSGAPLLIQSHPSVQCSMILLVFTNVFVAVIDFFFLLYSMKRIRSASNPSFIFSLHCMNRRRSAPFVVLPQSSYFWRGVQPCGTSPLAERCTCLSSPRSRPNDKHLNSAYGGMTAGEHTQHG